MCKHTKSSNKRIDPCIREFIKNLNMNGIKTYASCCGHNKYPLTVVCKTITELYNYDLISETIIPRKTIFYFKDKNEFYYIPEVQNGLSKI